MFLFVNGFALASISEILHCSVVDRRLQQGSIEKNNVVMQSTLFRIYSIRAPFLMELRKQDIARRCQLWYRKPLRSQSRSNASRNTDVRNSRIKTTCFYETMQPHWWQITFFFFYLQKLIHLHYTHVHNVSHLSSTDFSWSGAIPFGIISTFNFEMTNLMIYSAFGRLCAYLPNFFALNIVSSLTLCTFYGDELCLHE